MRETGITVMWMGVLFSSESDYYEMMENEAA